MIARRHMQAEVPIPDTIPLAIATRLHHTGWTWAEQFRRNDILSSYRPKIAQGLAEEYLAIAGAANACYLKPDTISATRTRVASTWTDAHQHLLYQHAELQKAQLSKAFDEQAIRDYAENYARLCSQMHSLESREAFARDHHVEPPAGPNLTPAGAMARLDDPKWWRRQLRRTWNRRAENVFRASGIVRKGREPYASDDAVRARTGQKVRWRKFLESHEVANESGDQLPLLDVAEKSLANPRLRRGEFMVRCKGFEEIADSRRDVAHFWTLTAPSIYHASHYTGERNEKFAGHDPREAQAWLCKQWARVRAKLKRLSILVYGFRIAEPHHDATPHWHLLLFVPARDAATVERVITGYWLAEHAEELGPRDPQTGRRPRESARVKLIEIDRKAGSATGYIAKYVSKNIDGHGGIGDERDGETGVRVLDGIRRVDTWASLHGIRQFQQIGGPPVGVYREVRRIHEPVADGCFELIRRAADRGDWAAFIRARSYDGIRAPRKAALRLERIAAGERNQYGEASPTALVGVRFCSSLIITRPNHWRIQKCGTSLPASHSSQEPEPASRWRPSMSDTEIHIRAGTLHPFGGICGLGLGDKFRAYDPETGRMRKGRARRHRVPQPERRPAAPPQGRASDSSSSAFLPPWTRGNNCTVLHAVPSPGRVFWEWESRVNAFYLKHGRYPALAETQQLANESGP